MTQANLSSALHVRFPGESFISMAEFELYTGHNKSLLDTRYLHERRLAEGAPQPLVREGTCAPCLRVTQFTSRIEAGQSDPNWREGQTCDCADGLGNRARAALHFVESVAGLAEWSRVLLFGPPDILDRRLGTGRAGFVRQSRLTLKAGAHLLDLADSTCHAVVSWDHLHHVPPLAAALAEIRRVLAPGGSFVFTVPFRYRSASTVSHLEGAAGPQGMLVAELDREVHELGWDLLDMLRSAGFARPLAHLYWSEELGYLGPYNMLFSATA